MVKAVLDADWVIGLADNGGEIGADGVLASRFGRILVDAVVVVVVCLVTVAVKLLIQLPRFLGRQFVEVFPAFTQLCKSQFCYIYSTPYSVHSNFHIRVRYTAVTVEVQSCTLYSYSLSNYSPRPLEVRSSYSLITVDLL